jgi:hypothetical protein
MKQKKYLKILGTETFSKLLSLHYSYDYNLIHTVMMGLYGWPTNCLICSKILSWSFTKDNGEPRKFADIDAWFCMNHCPIDSDKEWIETKRNEIQKIS